MSRFVRTASMALLLAVVVLGTAWSESYRVISIRNAIYKGKTMTLRGRLYLPLEAYARAMGLTLQHQGACWRLDDKRHENDKCGADTAATLHVNGVKVQNALETRNGVVWVAARTVTKALHGRYIATPAAGELDIAMPYVPPPPAAVMPKDLPVEAGAGKTVMVHWFANW